jgi:hypothetical protein
MMLDGQNRCRHPSKRMSGSLGLPLEGFVTCPAKPESF